MIVLKEFVKNTKLSKLATVIAFKEKPAGIFKGGWLQDDHVRQLSRDPYPIPNPCFLRDSAALYIVHTGFHSSSRNLCPILFDSDGLNLMQHFQAQGLILSCDFIPSIEKPGPCRGPFAQLRPRRCGLREPYHSGC